MYDNQDIPESYRGNLSAIVTDDGDLEVFYPDDVQRYKDMKAEQQIGIKVALHGISEDAGEKIQRIILNEFSPNARATAVTRDVLKESLMRFEGVRAPLPVLPQHNAIYQEAYRRARERMQPPKHCSEQRPSMN